MDSFRRHFKEIAGSSIDHLPSSAMDHEGHWSRFVQELQIAVWVPQGITGVREYTTIQQRSVDIPNHASNIPESVGLLRFALTQFQIPDI